MFSHELQGVLFENPFSTISKVAEALSLTRQTDSKRLHKLEKTGLLKSRQHGGRLVVVNTSLLEAISTSTWDAESEGKALGHIHNDWVGLDWNQDSRIFQG